jgi:hypothetical protein
MLSKAYKWVIQIAILILLIVLIKPLTLLLAYPFTVIFFGGEAGLFIFLIAIGIISMGIIYLSFYILFIEKDKDIRKETVKSILKIVFPMIFLISLSVSFVVTKIFYFNIIVAPFLLVGSLILSFLYFIPLYVSRKEFEPNNLRKILKKNLTSLFTLEVMFALFIFVSPLFMGFEGEAGMIIYYIWYYGFQFLIATFVLGVLLSLLQYFILNPSKLIKVIFIILILGVLVSGVYGYTQNKSGQDWTKLAIENNDITLCNKVEYDRFYCQTDFAISKGNDSFCGLIDVSGLGSGNRRDICYSSVASKLNDASICEKIAFEEQFKIYCRALATNNLDLCNNLPDLNTLGGGRSICIKEIAIKRLDPSLCEKIPEEDMIYKSQCYQTIAFETKNPELCSMIPEQHTSGIENCLKQSS